jgi:hypothetical protein
MVFLKLFYNQDITGTALIAKNEAWKKVIDFYCQK